MVSNATRVTGVGEPRLVASTCLTAELTSVASTFQLLLILGPVTVVGLVT